MSANRSILLVEDNPGDAFLFQEFLADKHNPFAIHWVKDGEEVLSYLNQQNGYSDAARPDIIVLDLSLPKANGYEVLKQIKDDQKLATIPVVILTTSRNASDQQRCKALGASLFFSKPEGLDHYNELAERLVNRDFPSLLRA